MLKRLSVLGFLLLPALAPASAELDRAEKALDHGELAKARFLYKQVLELDPCDKQALAGLGEAEGDPAPYSARCKGGPAPALEPADAKAELRAEAVAPEPTPKASDAPMEYPRADHRPASLKGEAAPGKDVAVAVGPDAPAAPAPDDQGLGVNEPGAEAKGHHHGGGPRRSQLEREHPILATLGSASFWGGLIAWGVLAGALALGIVWLSRRRAAAKAAQPDGEAAAEPADAEAAVPAPAAPEPAPVPSPPTPQALPPEQAAMVPAPWASPLTPGEAVLARLDSARVQAGLTAHQFYFTGPRGVKEGWFRREERLTLAVPLNQVTGLAWSERGGERLIIGTALAGDIALHAGDFGALALRQFAQALSQALEQPLG